MIQGTYNNGIINNSHTVLLIHSNASAGSTTFSDSSQSGHTIVKAGTPIHSNNRAKFYSTSNFTDAGSSETIGVAANADFNFSNKPFTISFWQNSDDTNVKYIMSMRNASPTNSYFTLNWENSGANVIDVNFNDGSWNAILQATVTHSTATWYHIAIVRIAANSWMLFVNGDLVDTGNNTVTLTESAINWGSYDGSSVWQTQYTEELKVDKGVALYNRSFTVPNRAN